jgi:uncharacterized membrane protein YgcG
MLSSLSSSIALILSAIVSIGILAIGIFVIATFVRAFAKNRRGKRSSPYSNKQVAIRTYAQQLGKKLQERYGVQAKYPPERIKSTIRESGWSGDRDCYGIAMYADSTDFIEYHRSIGEICDYDAMRSEIGECLSLPDNTFSPSDAIEAGELFTNDDTPPMPESSPSSDYGGGWSFWGSSDGGGSSYDGGSSSSCDAGSSSYDGGGDCGGGGYDGGSY